MGEYELRMYTLALYQLTGYQSAIQCAHANDAFANKFEIRPEEQPYLDYLKWRRNDMTIILLNGGSSVMLTEAIAKLDFNHIPHATFKEPDLYNQITAVSFLVDERVWNKEKYPDDAEFVQYLKTLEYYEKIISDLRATSDFLLADEMLQKMVEEKQKAAPVFAAWSRLVGGDRNVFLREFLKRFRLHGA